MLAGLFPVQHLPSNVAQQSDPIEITLFMQLLCLGECLDGAQESPLDRAIAVAWSPNGDYLASLAEDRQLRIWHSASGMLLQETFCDFSFIAPNPSIAWLHDGYTIIAGCTDDDESDLNTTVKIRGVGDWGKSIALSPDGSQLALGNVVSQVTILATNSMQTLVTLEHVQEYSVRTPTADELPQSDTFDPNLFPISSMAWSPDGRYLAVASSNGWKGQLFIWGVASQVIIHELFGYLDVAWSPDSNYVASNNAELSFTVGIWNVNTSDVLQVFPLDGSIGASVAWHPIQPIVAIGDASSDIHFANVDSGEIIHTQVATHLSLEGSRVLDIAWSPDGTRLASGGDDGNVVIWGVPD